MRGWSGLHCMFSKTNFPLNELLVVTSIYHLIPVHNWMDILIKLDASWEGTCNSSLSIKTENNFDYPP